MKLVNDEESTRVQTRVQTLLSVRNSTCSGSTFIVAISTFWDKYFLFWTSSFKMSV